MQEKQQLTRKESMLEKQLATTQKYASEVARK